MKIKFSIVFFLLVSYLFASDQNEIVGQMYTIYSNDLDSDISFVLYDPHDVSNNEEVTVIFYIFGDFLFGTFAGSVNYLSKEMGIINKCILVGINEIPNKQIGQYQKEYSGFITGQLTDTLSKMYSIKNDCILFGHSRASRLAGQVILDNPIHIRNFILSAPGITDEYLDDLEKLLSQKSERISIFFTQSEEDMKRNEVGESNQKLIDVLTKYESHVNSKYQYFDGETHMSIPPLSFYYGIKYLLK